MPGKASLRAAQYYAHPRNAFWKIAGDVLGIDPAAPYRSRVSGLRREGIALWDVLKSCTRESSLDSDIDESSIVVNDLRGFLIAHPRIKSVCFNGQKAESTYHKRILPDLSDAPTILYHRLPSTSPANASISYAKKLASWRIALEAHSRDA